MPSGYMHCTIGWSDDGTCIANRSVATRHASDSRHRTVRVPSGVRTNKKSKLQKKRRQIASQSGTMVSRLVFWVR